MHLKHSINDGVVLHEIVPHIKRYPVSHTPKKKHILWRRAAAPTAAISMCIIYRCLFCGFAVFNSDCVNCLKSAHQLHSGIDILSRFYRLYGGCLTAYLTDTVAPTNTSCHRFTHEMFFTDNFFILNTGTASELLYKPFMGSRKGWRKSTHLLSETRTEAPLRAPARFPRSTSGNRTTPFAFSV